MDLPGRATHLHRVLATKIMTPPNVRIAEDAAAVGACFAVLSQLRPQLFETKFVDRVLQLRDATGFRLAYLEDDGAIRAVAGYRIADWLHAGKYLEIEDLVTAADSRSRGY